MRERLSLSTALRLKVTRAVRVLTALILSAGLIAVPIASARSDLHETHHWHQGQGHRLDPKRPRFVFQPPALNRKQATLVTDVAVDEDFRRRHGNRWRDEVNGMIAAAGGLLAEVGIRLEVGSISEWESDDSVNSMPSLLASSVNEVTVADGHLLLVVTCQDTVKYDGFAQRETGAIIASYQHDSPTANAALISHELGHLLGAEHHEEDEECDSEGCIMDGVGYAHSDAWCTHHRDKLLANVDQLTLAEPASIR